MTGRIRAARFAAVLLALAPLLAGCAATRSVTQTVSGWFGTEEAAPPRAYYVATARAKLYREPDASSEVVGQLERSEGVLAYRVENGFAWVRAEPSGRSGWVRTTDLADRPPSARAPSRPPAPSAAAPAEPATPAEAQPEPPAPPEGEPEPEPPAPPDKSVFDPY